ncbi:MAG TPA: peptidyl-prolyl cis-trans isomerase [Steroidobacteraceae bacterium]
MLQRIRDRLHGTFAYVVLGPIVLVFVAWGAYGIVNLSVGGANYAAEADGGKVSLEEARNAWLQQQAQWQQRLGGAELPPALRTQLQDQVLEGLVRNTLLTQRTQKLGYRVGHDDLVEAIQSEPAFQVGGQYSAEAAKARLAAAGISLNTFQDDLRQQLQRTQLEGGIRISDFLTPVEFARLTNLENQEREVRFFVLPAAAFKPASAVDAAAVQAYYKEHQAQFMTTESAHLQYAQLRLETLAAQVSVTDADLRAAYDKEKSKFQVPEKRHARHILITGKDDAAALKQAQDVLAQAKAGKDFAALAQQYSQDPGSAKNGGDLGWAERSSFVAPFADALFAMAVGEIKGPIKTEFGYHIIRLDEIQAAKGKSFEEARPELDAQVRRDRATDRFGEIQEQLQSKVGEPGADLTALASQYQLQQGDVPDFLKGAGAAPLGAAPGLQELVFGDPPLAVGHLGGPALMGDDALAIVKVIEHRKPTLKPLNEVRETIVAAITRERAKQATLAAAQSARTQLEGGAEFDAVARKLGVAADPAHFVSRKDPSTPAPIRDAVFAAPLPAGKPVYRALALENDSAAVVVVTRVRTAPARDPQAQAERAQSQVRNEGLAAVMAYVDEVRRTATVRKNPKAFD